MNDMKIQIGYTPTADDAYMLYGLITSSMDAGDWEIEPIKAALPQLNDHASRSQYDVTMVSAATYAFVQDRYALLPCGASFAKQGGPVIVAREQMDQARLATSTVAIPGATTTAYTMLQLYNPAQRTRILPFDKLLPAVETGLADSALVIHEEFVTYNQWGLQIVLDLGEWWREKYQNLPMPVTCCVVRNTMPAEKQTALAELLRKSIQFSMDNHAEAMDFAMTYANTSDRPAVEKFVRQYVNELSLDMGPNGKASLKAFFDAAAESQILPAVASL